MIGKELIKQILDKGLVDAEITVQTEDDNGTETRSNIVELATEEETGVILLIEIQQD